MKEELDAIARVIRVAELLSVDCPVCNSPAGRSCCYVPWEAWELLDLAHSLYGHQERIVHAVRSGAATYADVVAQYGAFPPRWLQELA